MRVLVQTPGKVKHHEMLSINTDRISDIGCEGVTTNWTPAPQKRWQMKEWHFIFIQFLVACTRLYNSLCPSVCPSVCRSVTLSFFRRLGAVLGLHLLPNCLVG